MRVDGVDYCDVCYNPEDECTCDPEQEDREIIEEMFIKQNEEEIWEEERREMLNRLEEEALCDAIMHDGEEMEDDFWEDELLGAFDFFQDPDDYLI